MRKLRKEKSWLLIRWCLSIATCFEKRVEKMIARTTFLTDLDKIIRSMVQLMEPFMKLGLWLTGLRTDNHNSLHLGFTTHYHNLFIKFDKWYRKVGNPKGSGSHIIFLKKISLNLGCSWLETLTVVKNYVGVNKYEMFCSKK